MQAKILPYWRTCLPFLVLMTGAYLLYLQVFSGVWLMDDLPVVVNNPDIRSLGNFLEDYYPGRPLRELTYMLDYSFFGLNPSGYYIQNIFWHGLCSWLVFRLGKQLGAASSVAWFAALLFLLHPIQVEVVANISHRKDSLVLAFCLLSFWSYLYGRDSAADRRRWWLLASCLLGGIALLAKQNALALPLVIIAFELHKLSPRYRRSVFPAAMLVTCLGLIGRLVYLVNDQAFQENITPALLKLGSFVHGSVEKYFLTVFKAWTFMMSKLIYPVDLSMEYTFQVPTQWADPWVLFGVVGTVIFALGFLWAVRHSVIVYVALAWFLAFWLPTSNLLGHLSYFAADRYWYAPFVGLALLTAYGLWKLVRENLQAYVVIALLLSCLGWQTWRQQGYWHDAVVFYEHMLEVNPDALEGLIGLGSIAMGRGDYREATDYFQKAQRRSPKDARIPQNLGYIASKQGQHDAAVVYFQQALAIDPGKVEVYNNLGSVYDDLGQTERAIGALERALEINSHYEKGYTNLGVVYERIGRLEKAEALHRRALIERPDYAEAHYNLGNTLYHADRKQEAMASYLVAIQLLPENLDALYNYAVVTSDLGYRDLSLSTLAKVRRISPQLAAQLEKELQ